MDRKYYLFDEPFTGIEPIIIEKITEKILEQKRMGKGILITDHYYRYVVDIIDNCYLLKNGYIQELSGSGNFSESLAVEGYLPN